MTYYVDLSKYQSTDVSKFKRAGASGVIAQITVSTNIIAQKCKAQLHSAKVNNMHRLTYHYATFGHNVTQAIKEAKFACKRAKTLGFKSIHIFCDWEQQDNDTHGTVSQNTRAILAFMREVKREGFTAGLYSSASLLHAKINIKPIIRQFGSCLWVASYPRSGRSDHANMHYFPSIDGVCIWQFTDNWHGLNVDGNKVVYDPFELKDRR